MESTTTEGHETGILFLSQNVQTKMEKKKGRETTLRTLSALPLQSSKSEHWLMLTIAYLEAVGTCCLI